MRSVVLCWLRRRARLHVIIHLHLSLNQHGQPHSLFLLAAPLLTQSPLPHLFFSDRTILSTYIFFSSLPSLHSFTHLTPLSFFLLQLAKKGYQAYEESQQSSSNSNSNNYNSNSNSNYNQEQSYAPSQQQSYGQQGQDQSYGSDNYGQPQSGGGHIQAHGSSLFLLLWSPTFVNSLFADRFFFRFLQ